MIDSTVILELLAFCGKGIANAGLKDIYEKWKARIKTKISSTNIGKSIEPEKLVEEYEQNPEIWKQPMKSALDEAQVDKDDEIIKGALHLLILQKPTQQIGTVQGFNNNGTGTQINVGNKGIDNSIVYNQVADFFDEIEERNGIRTRKTYRRDPGTGKPIIVNIELA
ncbi:hypothetical protein ACWATR_39075 [Nostoc sp. UIC 10890]